MSLKRIQRAEFALYVQVYFLYGHGEIACREPKRPETIYAFIGWNTINITGPLGENAHIGVNAEGVPRSFISGWSNNMAGKDPVNYFSSDGDACGIGLNTAGDVVLGNLCTTITLNPNGGTLPEFSPVAGAALPIPSKTGYTFAGWYENPEFSGNPVTDIPTNSAENLNFYAKWTANTYTVTFDANGGSVSQTSAVTVAGKLTSLPTPTYDGYDFLGWYTQKDGGDKVTTDTVFTVDSTIYAHWQNIPVIGVKLDKTSLTLQETDSATLTATVEPDNATNKNVTWSSSPGGVVTLTPDPADSRKAIITAMGTGTAAITAAATDGSGKSASCTVTVSRPYYPVTGITLDQTSLSMEKGDTVRLHAAVTPSYATNPTVTWSSSDETVAAVDRTGRVTALGGGTAVITARAGSYSAACTVTVTVPVAGITLDQGSLELFPGGQAALTASLFPEDTTEQTVVWSSSNEAVAVVEEDPTVPAGDSGEAPIAPSASHTAAVTAVGKGTAVITAATADGAFSASCTVTVPGTPSATALTVSGRTTSSVTLSWDAVEEAEGYTIWYRSEYESSVTRKIIWDGDTASWTKTGLEPGTKYFFAIRSWVTDADGNYIFSDVSSTQRGTTKPEAAVIQSVTASGGYVKVRLAGEAEGARRYSICYGDSRNGFTENTFQVGIRTSYTVRTMTPKLEPGTYYICVKSYRDLGNHKRVYGDWSNIVRVVVR